MHFSLSLRANNVCNFILIFIWRTKERCTRCYLYILKCSLAYIKILISNNSPVLKLDSAICKSIISYFLKFPSRNFSPINILVTLANA